MRLRKLRIAWSVGWGVLAALLMLLWVRSYWFTDLISRIDGRRIATTIGSQYGAIYFAHFDATLRRSADSSEPRPWASKSLSGYTANHGLFVWKRRRPTSLYAALPHWFVATVAVAIGTGIWLPWRFNLRTLLIATTLVAVVLGLVVYALRTR